MYHGYARIWDLWMYEYNIYAHNPVERSKKVIEGEMMTKETKRNKKNKTHYIAVTKRPVAVTIEKKRHA